MGNRVILAVTVATAVGLAGCARPYQPIVDLKEVNLLAYEQDLAECRALAGQVDVGGETIGAGLVGAAIGAAIGAATGAVVGAPGTGAAFGAAAAGTTGLASGAAHGVATQEQVLRRCLDGRGYRVLN